MKKGDLSKFVEDAVRVVLDDNVLATGDKSGPRQAGCRLRAACSRTASAWARATPGNQARNWSSVAPPSRFSNSELTGTRVPWNTHAPLTLSGSRSTAWQVVQSSM